MENQQPAASDNIEAAFSYTRADGTIETANSIEEAQRVCPFLGGLSVEEAEIFLSLMPQETESAQKEEPIQQPAEKTERSFWQEQASTKTETTKTTGETNILSADPEGNNTPSLKEARTASVEQPALAAVPLQEIAAGLIHTRRQANELAVTNEKNAHQEIEQLLVVQNKLEQDFQQLAPQADAAPETSVLDAPRFILQEPIRKTIDQKPKVVSLLPKTTKQLTTLAKPKPAAGITPIRPQYEVPVTELKALQETISLEAATDDFPGAEEILDQTNFSEVDITDLFTAAEVDTEPLPVFNEDTAIGTTFIEDLSPELMGGEIPSDELLAPFISTTENKEFPESSNPELTQAIVRLQETADAAELEMLIGTTPELTEQTITDIVLVLEQLGCDDPQEIIRKFTDSHGLQELFDTLEQELPELSKLVDYQQYLLASLGRKKSQSDRLQAIARALYDLLSDANQRVAARAA